MMTNKCKHQKGLSSRLREQVGSMHTIDIPAGQLRTLAARGLVHDPQLVQEIDNNYYRAHLQQNSALY